jgi:hypothetical protein
VQTTTVTVSGTGILEESADCNYYLLHYNLLPRVTGNMYLQYEPSDIVVPDIDRLISKEEFDTLKYKYSFEFGESFVDFNEFQLKGICV